MPEKVIKLDAKFEGTIRRVKDGAVLPDDGYIVFRPHDNAFFAILPNYRSKCEELGADPRQLTALDRMIARVADWRSKNKTECKVPDIEPDEKLLDESGNPPAPIPEDEPAA